MNNSSKIYLITNIPAPYRHHLFNKIAENYPNFTVIYSLSNESDRKWGNSLSEIRYNYIIFEKKIRSKVKTFNIKILKIIIGHCNKNTIFMIGSCGVINKYIIVTFSYIMKYKYIMISDGEINNSLSLIKKIRKKIICKYSSGILVPGKRGKEFFEGLGIDSKKIYNSYFSHDIQYFKKYYDKKQYFRDKIRGTLGICDDDIVILTISRFLDWKRLEDLFEALNLVKDDEYILKKLQVLLIGNGEYTKPIVEFLKSQNHIKINWIRSMAYNTISEYYASADFFVLPSEGDIWGLVVNEALSMGLPVICTKKIGASELIKDGINGFIIPARKPIVLANRIRILYENINLREKMSSEAIKIHKTWNSTMAIESITKLLNKLD